MQKTVSGSTLASVPHDVKGAVPRVARRRALRKRVTTPRAAIPDAWRIGIGCTVCLFCIGIWALVSYTGVVSTLFLPTPTAIVLRAREMVDDGSLWTNTWASLQVVMLGFFVSSVLAIPIGLVAGTYRAVQAAIGPIVGFTRYLPVTSFVPLFILWIGIGLDERAAIVFFGVFFQQIVMAADSAGAVPDDLLNAAYTLGSTRRDILMQVILPAALPGLIDMLRVTVAWGWTYLVVAELVGASSGLGYMSMQAMRGFQVDTIFLAIGIIGLLGLITDQLFRIVRRRIAPWAR